MDYKIFAKFLIGLGIIILAYGGIVYAGNLPLTREVLRSAKIDIGGYTIQGDSLIWHRASERKRATYFMLGGGAVLFLGIGVSASVKNN